MAGESLSVSAFATLHARFCEKSRSLILCFLYKTQVQDEPENSFVPLYIYHSFCSSSSMQ